MAENETKQKPPYPSDATVRAVMALTGWEYTDAIWWRTDNPGSSDPFDADTLRLYVPCNDLFFWGCSDLEEVTDANLGSLIACVVECEDIVGKHNADDAFLLWVARQRGIRPQGAYYKHLDPALIPLFDAAGPAREVGLGNPHPHPDDAAEAPSLVPATSEEKETDHAAH